MKTLVRIDRAYCSVYIKEEDDNAFYFIFKISRDETDESILRRLAEGNQYSNLEIE